MIGENVAQVQLRVTSRMEKNRTIVDQLTIGGPETLQKFCEILRNSKRLVFIERIHEEKPMQSVA